jgi:hypothetical protein
MDPLTLIVVIIFVAGVAVVVGLAIAAAVSTYQKAHPSPPQNPSGGSDPCFSYCLGVLKFRCGDGQFLGGCLGVYGCDSEVVEQDCQ